MNPSHEVRQDRPSGPSGGRLQESAANSPHCEAGQARNQRGQALNQRGQAGESAQSNHECRGDSEPARPAEGRELRALDRLDRARERLAGWRATLEAAGFRTNLSLAPPCSLAARRADGDDPRWVRVLATGLVALELRDLNDSDAVWSRVSDSGAEPTSDDVLRAVRSLFTRTSARLSNGVGSGDGRPVPGAGRTASEGAVRPA